MRNLSWIILFPLAVVLIIFAVSNRGAVSIDLWPLPASLDIPLFVLLFAALVIGVFWGGVAAWISGGSARKAARIKVREAKQAETEIKRLKDQVSKLEADAKSRDATALITQKTEIGAASGKSPRLPPPADAA